MNTAKLSISRDFIFDIIDEYDNVRYFLVSELISVLLLDKLGFDLVTLVEKDRIFELTLKADRIPEGTDSLVVSYKKEDEVIEIDEIHYYDEMGSKIKKESIES